MLDFARLDHRLLDDVAEAVHQLVSRAGVDPAGIMLVGARCRDAIHSALGRTTPTRQTDDLDLAIAIASWQQFERIGETFPSIRDNDIAYRIADLPVDIVPFGTVAEDPRGLTRLAPREEDLVVFGFREVFDRAASLELASGESIRLPQPEGYTLLKVRAWADRSPDDKDAKDLAVALDWYAESNDVLDRLYGDDIDVAELYGFDLAQGAQASSAATCADNWILRMQMIWPRVSLGSTRATSPESSSGYRKTSHDERLSFRPSPADCAEMPDPGMFPTATSPTHRATAP